MNLFTSPGSNTETNLLTILGRTYHIYLTNFCSIVQLAFFTIIPSQILMYLSVDYILYQSQDLNDDSSIILLVFLIADYIGIFLYTLTAATIMQVAVNAHANKTSSVGDVLRSSKRYICSVFGSTLISTFLASIGMVLLIFPGVYLHLSWLFATPVIIVERKKVCSGLSRSWELSKGNRCYLFTSYIVFMLGFILVLFGFSFILASLGSLAMNRFVIWIVSRTIPIVLFLPLVYIMQVVLYFDLRARQESFDCAQLLAELALTSTNNGGASVPTGSLANVNMKPVETVDENQTVVVQDQVMNDSAQPAQPAWASMGQKSAEQKYSDFC